MTLPAANFPPLPAKRAQGAALFLEPIMGSGERLCVAVAARDDDGGFQAVPVLRPDMAKCLLGKQADQLMGFVRLGVSSMEHHLAQGGQVADWTPPTSGLSIGPVTAGAVDHLPMMLRALVRNHACLASLADFDADTLSDDQDGNQPSNEDPWPELVRQAVARQHPALAAYFQRKMRIVPDGAAVTFDYLGGRSAAQLGRLLPGRGLAQRVRAIKAKLWDLEALRDVAAKDLLHGQMQTYQVVLYRPHDDAPDYCERDIDAMHQSLTELELVGKAQDIDVRPVFTADSAAEHIITAEAA